jgi:hypothetical protein
MFTNRNFNLFIAVTLVVTLVVLIVLTVAPSAAAPTNSDSALQQRRGEWTTGVSSQQAYLDQRHGEQTTGTVLNASDINFAFRHAEEMAGVSDELASQAAYLAYRRGEWSGK